MPRRKINNEIKQYIRENYLVKPAKQIARDLSVSSTMVTRFMHKDGLHVSKEILRKFRSEALKGRTTFTEADDQYVTKHYLDMPIKRIADNIGRSYTGVMGALKRLGLELPEEVRDRNSLVGRFTKGQNPHNAGKTGIRVSVKSEFKKGHVPTNTRHDGAITIRTERCVKTGKQTKYKYIRLAMSKWEPLHRHMWRKYNGEIPKRHVIAFIDGDTMNCDITNLECISMAENARRNQNHVKQGLTIKLMYDEGWDAGARSLSDSYIAGILAEGDQVLKQLILSKHTDLIEVKRTKILINRKLKEHEKQTL